MALVYLSLGSNLGDRELILNNACSFLSELGIEITERSKLYESEPWGFDSPGWFYNEVVICSTSLSPNDLLLKISHCENQLGRKRDTSYSGYQSRTIDIDILFYDSNVIEEEFLIVPHPRLHERNFVLYPLNDLSPGFMHPVLNKTVNQLLRDSKDTTKVIEVCRANP